MSARDGRDGIFGPEFRVVGKIFQDFAYLGFGYALEEEGEEHFDGSDGVEALLVFAVFVARDEMAAFFVVQVFENRGFGGGLRRVAFHG